LRILPVLRGSSRLRSILFYPILLWVPCAVSRKRKEEKTITTTIACSVCRAAITPGAAVCPGCGLPLVAQAVPVIRRPAPIWPYVLGAIALFVLIVNVVSRHEEATRQAAACALHADLAGGKLTTPEAFVARCGKPRIQSGSTLTYTANRYWLTDAQGGGSEQNADLIVSYAPGSAPTYMFGTAVLAKHGQYKDQFNPASESEVEQVCLANAH
jgi:hypothetical protein